MSDPKTWQYERGDWVRFMRGGAPVIGQVEYVQKANSTNHRLTLVTTCGEVWETDVLEVRR